MRVNLGMMSGQGMVRVSKAPGVGRRVYLLPDNLE
jgi:hypothetical protein